MPTTYTLLCPPLAQQLTTGLLIAGEKEIRGKRWRAEIHASRPAQVTRDGKPNSTWPKPVRTMVHDLHAHAKLQLVAIGRALQSQEQRS